MKKLFLLILLLTNTISCNHEPFFFKNVQQVNFIYTKEKNIPLEFVYIDENYSVQKLLISNQSDNNISISLNQNFLTPVLLYTSPIDSKPKGCIYPISTEIDIYGGFAAWILYRIMLQTNENKQLAQEYLSHFNWQRFINYIQKYENPWMLNQDIIIENIVDKTFNVYSIKEKL